MPYLKCLNFLKIATNQYTLQGRDYLTLLEHVVKLVKYNSILKSRHFTKVHTVKAIFPVVMYECELNHADELIQTVVL